MSIVFELKPRTKYRFLKDTELFVGQITPAGFEFVTDNSIQYNHVFVRPGGYQESRAVSAYYLRTWLEDGRIEEVTPWKPKRGEQYYTVNSVGEVESATWFDTAVGEKRYELGNCFHHRKDAEEAAETIRVFFANLKKARI